MLDFLDDGTEYYLEHALSKMVSNRSSSIWGGVLLRLDKIREAPIRHNTNNELFGIFGNSHDWIILVLTGLLSDKSATCKI